MGDSRRAALLRACPRLQRPLAPPACPDDLNFHSRRVRRLVGIPGLFVFYFLLAKSALPPPILDRYVNYFFQAMRRAGLA